MESTSAKKVVANSFIYSISGLLIKCASLFLMPLYTAFLTTADYGITSIASSFIMTMSFIAGFSLFSSVMRFYVDLKDDEEKLKRFYGSVIVFTFLSCIVWGVLLSAFQAPLSKYVFSGIDYYPIILVCLVSLAFNVQHTTYTYILKSQQKAAKTAVLSILFFIVGLLLNILFVVVLKMGALGSLIATLISDFLFFVYFIVDMIRQKAIRFCLDFSLLKEALKYSVPLMPHYLSAQIAMLISKALIGGTASMASLGLYSIASQFGSVADLIQGYANDAYQPWMYEKLRSRGEGYDKDIRSTVKLLSGVIGLFMLGIGLFAQDYILLFLKNNYTDAWKFVPLIVVVFAFKTMYYFYADVLFYHKKASRVLFVATLSGSLINILLAAYLIPQLGAYGAVLADFLAMVVRVAIIIVISLRFEKTGMRILDLLINFAIVTGFIAVAMIPSYLGYVGESFSILYFLYKVAIVVVYLAVIFLQNRKLLSGGIVKKFLAKFSKKKAS